MAARSTLQETPFRRQAVADAGPAHSVSRPRARTLALWRQALGMVAWVGIVVFLAAGPVIASLLVVLGGVTLADAWISGIRKRPGSRSVVNHSPMAWGIAMALLLVVAYPAYLFNRKKLRTIKARDDFYWAVVVLGGIAYVSFVVLAVTTIFASRAI